MNNPATTLNVTDGASLGADPGVRPSLTSVVRQKIEDMVMSGEIGGGEWLNEKALAAELCISRAPVREAAHALAAEGLLIIKRNRGAFVREITLEDVLHGYDVRSGIARTAGRLAALRATADGIDALGALWDEMENARLTRDVDAYYKVNRTFHQSIVGMTGNPRLIEIHEQTERELLLYLRRGVTGPARMDVSNRQHRMMLDAITAGDDLASARAFERHVIEGKQRMLDTLVSSPANTRG